MIILDKHLTLAEDVIECPICKSGEFILVEAYTVRTNPIYFIGSRYPTFTGPTRTSVDVKCVCGISFTIVMIGMKVISKIVSWNSHNEELDDNNRYYCDLEEDVNNS